MNDLAVTASGAGGTTGRVHKWLELAETTLGNASDRLNAINIFPVPDGDTGSNLYETVRAARAAVKDLDTEASHDIGAVLATAGTAALDLARGNSGTLLAVVLAGMADPLSGHERLTAPGLAMALDRARTSAWAALSDPQEGTMLTVLDAAAQAAAWEAVRWHGQPDDQRDSRRALSECLDALIEAAWRAVVGTEDQLPALTEAHVVDAGGMGLLLVLDSLRASVLETCLDQNLLDGLHGFAPADPHIHADMEIGEGYELMCSITLDALAAATLRFGLNEIGDSVIMSPVHGGETGARSPGGEHPVRWRLHVHVTDLDAALGLVQDAGTPENLRVSSLDDEVARHSGGPPS